MTKPTVAFEQTLQIVTLPTASPAILFATADYADATKRSFYIEAAKLKAVKSYEKAIEVLHKESWLALTPEAIAALPSLKSRDYLEDKDFIVDPSIVTEADLYRDSRGYDGFLYKFGDDLPLNQTIVNFICASSADLSTELRQFLDNSPYTEVTGEDYVRGNGTTWYISVNIPDEMWAKIIRETRPNEKYFSTSTVWNALVHGWGFSEDPIGLHPFFNRED